MDNILKMIYSGLLTLATLVFGGYDIAAQLLLAAMIIDYISGLVKAGIKHKINSSIGFSGILKKVGMLALVTVAVIADQAMNLENVLRTLVIYYIMGNELISILENLGACGVKIPKKLKNVIEKLANEESEE